MKSRGWKLTETTDRHYLVNPPKEMKTEADTRFHLIREEFEYSSDYQENVRQITRSLAKLYDLDYYMLEEIFSKSVDQIKQYKEISTQLLANVA